MPAAYRSVLCRLIVPSILLQSLQSSSGLLLAFENACRLNPLNNEIRGCQIVANASLDALIEVILKFVEPFSEAKHDVNHSILPPFITYLVYKAAAILTEKIRSGDDSSKSLGKLKSLRYVLRSVNNRWLGAGK